MTIKTGWMPHPLDKITRITADIARQECVGSGSACG